MASKPRKTMKDLLGVSSTDSKETEHKIAELKKEVEMLRDKIHHESANRKNDTLENFESKYGCDFKGTENDGRVVPIFKIRKELPGHFGKIYAIAWASSSKNILSASQDGKLLIWDVITNNKKCAIPLRSSWVMNCCISPNEQLVASGGLDNIVSVFNVSQELGWAQSDPIAELQNHEGYISDCEFIDDKRVVSTSGDASVIVWDVESKKPINIFSGHIGDVNCIDIKPQNPNVFLTGSIDATAKIWDLRIENAIVSTFLSHASDVNSVRWFPSGDQFASGSDDSTVRIFCTKAHCQLGKLANENTASTVTCVDFSKSGYFCFVGYDEKPYAIVWKTLDCSLIDKQPELVHPARVHDMKVSPDGSVVATGSWDKILRIWA